MNRGYVLVWRKIQDSGLMQMPNTLAVFLHLLFSATHQSIKVGTTTGVIELQRGQYISGLHRLSKDLKQSVQQIRTSLSRLEQLGIISIKSTSKYSVYTIENYDIYQDPNKLATNKQQTDNKQTTTKQEHNTQKTHNKKTYIPDNFTISERVISWANREGYINLQKHLDNFVLSAQSKGYTYIDWDSAFMKAIRDNWAGVNQLKKGQPSL